MIVKILYVVRNAYIVTIISRKEQRDKNVMNISMETGRLVASLIKEWDCDFSSFRFFNI